MTYKYYHSKSKNIMKNIFYQMILSFGSFWILVSFINSTKLLENVIIFIALNALIIGGMLCRMRIPLIEISEERLKVRILFKSCNVKWDEIEDIVVDKLCTFGKKEKILKIRLKTRASATKEISFGLSMVEKSTEVVEKLREKIPERKYEDLKHNMVFQKPIKKTIQYKNWTFNEIGLKKDKKIIFWDDVKAIIYDSHIIAGYGATTVIYVDRKGKERRFVIRPASTEQYQEVIQYLISYSKKASIDPGLLKALEYSPEKAKRDFKVFSLFASSILITILGIYLFGYYSPTITSNNISSLIIVLLAVFPTVAIIKLLTNRFGAKTENSAKRTL